MFNMFRKKSMTEKAIDSVLGGLAAVGDVVIGTAEVISDAGSALAESCKSDKVVERTTTIHHYHRPVVIERKQPEVVVTHVVVSPVEEPEYRYTNLFLSKNHIWYYIGVYENKYGEYIIDVRRNSLKGRVVESYTAYTFSLYLKMEREIGEKIRRGYFD